MTLLILSIITYIGVFFYKEWKRNQERLIRHNKKATWIQYKLEHGGGLNMEDIRFLRGED